MFCLPYNELHRETLEDELASLPDALTPYFERDRREDGYRPGRGPRFIHTTRMPTPKELKAQCHMLMTALKDENEHVRYEADIELKEIEAGFVHPLEVVTCPICRCSHSVREESFSSYGGTTEGYTTCDFCGYTWSWADISAVI